LEAVAQRNADRYRREDELRDRAVEFEALKYQAAAVAEDTEAEVARVRAAGQARLDALQLQSAEQIAGMLALREPLGAVALRLGESQQTVKAFRSLVGGQAAPERSGHDVDGGSGVRPAPESESRLAG
jgi:hypothetical protein